tara:strand:- start:3714 stop:4196 length:483 start_codon:yes stop_codon:yes gene_type:complete
VSGFVTTIVKALLLLTDLRRALTSDILSKMRNCSFSNIRNRILNIDKIQNLFDVIDDVCAEVDQEHLEEDLDHIPASEIRDYWSEYNLRKRLLRSLYQTNRRILEFLSPETFKNHQEFRKKCLAEMEEKPDPNRPKPCLKCGRVLEEWEIQVCEGCIDDE